MCRDCCRLRSEHGDPGLFLPEDAVVFHHEQVVRSKEAIAQRLFANKTMATVESVRQTNEPCISFTPHFWKKDMCRDCKRSQSAHVGDDSRDTLAQAPRALGTTPKTPRHKAAYYQTVSAEALALGTSRAMDPRNVEKPSSSSKSAQKDSPSGIHEMMAPYPALTSPCNPTYHLKSTGPQTARAATEAVMPSTSSLRPAKANSHTQKFQEAESETKAADTHDGVVRIILPPSLSSTPAKQGILKSKESTEKKRRPSSKSKVSIIVSFKNAKKEVLDCGNFVENPWRKGAYAACARVYTSSLAHIP